MTDVTAPEELSDVVVTTQRNPFSISTFIKEIEDRNGLLNPNLFTISITDRGGGGNINTTKTLSILCDSAQMPGLTLGTDDTIQRFGYGPTHRAVWGVVFTPLTLEFIVDGQGATHKAITEWFNNIVYYNDETHEAQPGAEGMPFFVNYQSTYARTIVVYNHEAKGRKAVSNTFLEAFPIRMSEVLLNNNTRNGLIRITVSFSYVRHITAYLTLEEIQYADLESQSQTARSALRNSRQLEPSAMLANDLNQRFASYFVPVTSADTSLDRTDILFRATNGIFTNPIPRPVDLSFEPASLFN